MPDQETSSPTPASPPAMDAPDPGVVDLPQRTTPALVMSLILHALMLTTIGLIWSRTSHGTDAPADRPVGIALVHRMPDRTEYIDVAEAVEQPTQTSEETTASSDPSAAAAPPADFSPPIDLSGVLKAMEATPQPVSGSGIAGETDLDGDAFDVGRGAAAPSDSGQATTTVFGVTGSGSRFVYVFDRSDSMNGYGGKPLRAAKRELVRSLQTLSERQRFQIVFYNDKPTHFRMPGTPTQLVIGEDSTLTQAQQYVNSIAAFGGTEHADALKFALRLGPDVIFFLTDARIPRLSNVELREIQDRADRSGTSIHAIEFGVEPAAPVDSFLKDLAAMNRGQYQYIDVRSLD